MSEDVKTPTTPGPGEGKEGQVESPPEPSTQPTEPPSQGDVQPEPEPAGTVEPAQSIANDETNRRSQNLKPTDYIKWRHERRMFEQRIRELENRIQNQNPAVSSQPRKFTADEFYAEPEKFFDTFAQEIEARAEARLKELLPRHFEEYQIKLKQAEENEQLKKRISKLELEGKWDLVMDEFENDPKLNFGVVDPMLGIDMALERVEKKMNQGTPLASKKSRMGITGSGNPINGGSNRPTLEQLKARKAKLQEKFGENFGNPEFMKEWDHLTDDLSKLAKEKAESR